MKVKLSFAAAILYGVGKLQLDAVSLLLSESLASILAGLVLALLIPIFAAYFLCIAAVKKR